MSFSRIVVRPTRSARADVALTSAVVRRNAKVLTVFGTRPEIIKLAPIIREIDTHPSFTAVNVTSSQHTDLLYPFVRFFDIRVDYDLQVMRPDQGPNDVCANVIAGLDLVIKKESPDVVIVQGDTTTALASALAAFYRSVPVAHVEAGLRSGNDYSPYPEEMNRKLISRLAAYHFAATARNRDTLLSEGVPRDRIFVTGNPVVDVLQSVVRDIHPGPVVLELLQSTARMKRLVLTTHRRESLGERMSANLKVLRAFADAHEDVVVLFPAHPNPRVRASAEKVLNGQPRIRVFPPLEYQDFIWLLANSWLIVSDSGGVQEEAPTLRKPLLIIRENTERPEAVDAGVARLVGGVPARLAVMLEEVYRDGSWMSDVEHAVNPFGNGDAAPKIVSTLAEVLNIPQRVMSSSTVTR